MQMPDAEGFGYQLVLEIDDVTVIIVRKFRLQSVARFARLAVTHVVGKNQIVAVRVERTPWVEQRLRVSRAQQRAAVRTGPVQDQDGVVDGPLCIAMWRAERCIVKLQPGQRLAVPEFVIVEPGIGLNGRRIHALVPWCSSIGGSGGGCIGLGRCDTHEHGAGQQQAKQRTGCGTGATRTS